MANQMKTNMRTSLLIVALVGALIAPTVAQASSAKESKHAGSIYFGASSSHLDKADKKKLNVWISELKNAKSVTVTGYVQDSANDSNNKSLSRSRAANVARYLKAHGVTAPIRIVAKGLPAKHRHSKYARRATVNFSNDSTSTPVTPVNHSLTFTSYAVSGDTTDCNNFLYNSFPYSAKVSNSNGTFTKSFSPVTAVPSTVSLPYYASVSVCEYQAVFDNVLAGNYSYELTAKAGLLQGYGRLTFWADTQFHAQGQFTVPEISQTGLPAALTWESHDVYRLGFGSCEYQAYPTTQTEIVVANMANLTMPDASSTGPKTILSGGCD